MKTIINWLIGLMAFLSGILMLLTAFSMVDRGFNEDTFGLLVYTAIAVVMTIMGVKLANIIKSCDDEYEDIDERHLRF